MLRLAPPRSHSHCLYSLRMPRVLLHLRGVIQVQLANGVKDTEVDLRNFKPTLYGEKHKSCKRDGVSGGTIETLAAWHVPLDVELAI